MSITIPGLTGPAATLNNPSSAAGGVASAIPANMQISESGFLQLITTQLKNQNPLNPTDPTQFLAQIEGLSEVSSLQSMQTSLQSGQLTSGAALLGRSVLAPGSTALLAAGGELSGAASAPAGATSLTVSITDASGNPVSSFQVAPQPSGLTSFTWNGKDAAGNAAPAGEYGISVSATVAGTSEPVNPLVQSQVTSVTIDPSTQALELETTNGTVALSSVASIL